MNIKKIRIHTISMPLKKPFVTHLQKVENREGMIIEVEDREGIVGLGEAVAFSTPWYTEETVRTCFHMLKDVLIPLLRRSPVSHPEELRKVFDTVRGNAMAKASMEMAVWDLYARQKEKPLWSVIGGTREKVLAGAVVGNAAVEGMIAHTQELVDEGYERIKIKISKGSDIEVIRALRNEFPHLQLLADANSAYTLKDTEHLRNLDEFRLEMIEQPLGVDDLVEHAILQKELQTPICLDESIVTPHDMKSAIHLGSCGVVNIKLGRVGGYNAALDIYRLCQENGIRLWCGGMIEFGVSRAHNISLATLEGFSIPGDISSSLKYWDEDIIDTPIIASSGYVKRFDKSGIGVDLNQRRLKEVCENTEEYLL
jgi:o-succinylbenzoate synthase